jgi:hypothetical protein
MSNKYNNTKTSKERFKQIITTFLTQSTDDKLKIIENRFNSFSDNIIDRIRSSGDIENIQHYIQEWFRLFLG